MKEKPPLIICTSLRGGGAEHVARLMVESFSESPCVLFENNAHLFRKRSNLLVIGKRQYNSLVLKILINVYRTLFVQVVKICLRPTVTISHLEGPNFINLLTVGGGKRIIFVHNVVDKNYDNSRRFDVVKKCLVGVLYKRADLVIAVSSEIRKNLIKGYGVGRHRVKIISNPIDLDAILREANQMFGGFRDSILRERFVVSIGSLTVQKNHELLLRAFKEVRDRGENLKLVLLGEGPEEGNIKKVCVELGLSTQESFDVQFDPGADVYLNGYQANPYPFIKYSALFLMTSMWEGLPVSLLEALSLGKPVIISDCSSGIRDVLECSRLDEIAEIDHKQTKEEWSGLVKTDYGYLMTEYKLSKNPKVIGVWANAIIELLNDVNYYEKCVRSAKIRAREFDLEKVREQWENILFPTKEDKSV